MTPKPIAILLTAFVFVFSMLGTASAADGPGTKAVRKANDEISRLLAKKAEPGSAEEKKLAEQVTASVRDFLDVEELGRLALRDHWKTLPAEQQQEFMTLLRTLIEKNYIKGLRANLEYQVVYVSESKKDDSIVVRTEVKTKRRGRPYTVGIDYVLRKDERGLRAYDVVTDGVGLVENYRAQFNKLINKHGFEGLLERMRKKADKL